MLFSRNAALKKSRLSAALLAAIIVPATAGSALAQTAAEQAPVVDSATTTNLEKVVVTGSLIPQTELETFVPVTIITAEDIKARAFSSLSEVLQKTSFATGAVQGAQNSASFTQGTETVSLFGLPPGYVKYLIDGRPMANYPALYNGSDTFNNISGIPIDLVDRIEILPGGQSSIYGSDAIAGVINVILKKKMEGLVFSIRGGAYSEGGGSSTRFSIADGFSSNDGRFNALAGLQYEERDPIWAYQRDLTRQFNTDGDTPPLISRDYLVNGYYGSYYFMDPNDCANVTSQFGGTMALQQRPGFGEEFYCGSPESVGYRTLLNEKKALQAYVHGTFDVSDNTQLYGDVLYSNEKTRYHVGSNYTWWGTGTDFGYFYDPNLDDYVNLQRSFSPEEMGPGGFDSTTNTDKSEAIRLNFGVTGSFGGTAWEYDVGVTHAQYELKVTNFVRFADKIDQYFIDHVLGPQQGLDPYDSGYPVFTPDYAAFYTVMSPEDFASFTGHASSTGKTKDSTLRAQVTNSRLFALPGGDAGFAVVAEFGKQDWQYDPDPGYLDGSIWGWTDVSGGGNRDRYALTSELRMPLAKMLTVTGSGRYDSFRASGRNIDKPTYSLGIEFRPMETLLVRGKYGTAFRAPTLSDLYQGQSGFYSFVTDYTQCAEAGFLPEQIDNCPGQFSSRQFFGTQAGNLNLKPIDADVWSVGLVWAPIDRFSMSVDYHSWDIKDEVTQQSANGLTLQEYRCNAGVDDIGSPLCQNTLAQITRNAIGDITEIFTPKINVSQQELEAVTASLNYGLDVGRFGDLNLRGSYTQNLHHSYQQYPEDAQIDLLNDPYWSSDPKRKADASLTWRIGDISTTAYANWRDKTPNNRAYISTDGYAAEGAHTLGSTTLYNMSVTYQPIAGLELSAMVNNVFNTMPPYDNTFSGSTGAPYNGYNFDVYGRSLYLEMRYAIGRQD
jgi:iron complex outermembrane recepter protein